MATATAVELDIPTAEVFQPLLRPARYKGAKGGRASGKSHFFAELAVEAMVCDPSLRFVCIREVQRSLKFSAKSLIERKLRDLRVSHLFEILQSEIRRRGGSGVMIFEGMQDHTADSLKSLEGFGRAWVEEAQSLSRRSVDLLLPTIRSAGSEVWFSWNPHQPEDPVDELFRQLAADGDVDHVLVHADYLDNPFVEAESVREAERMRRVDVDAYAHIWLGQYNLRSDAQVLAGKWRVDEFEAAEEWDGPYYGADWGFNDPTVLMRCWIGDERLWVDWEVGGSDIGLDEIAPLFRMMPGAAKHVIRADASRPDTIQHVRKAGLDVIAAPKGQGSVEDGVQFLRKFEEIVIHERCTGAQEEARLWSWKTDRLTGDPLPKLEDKHNHRWDAIRYALAPLIHRERRIRGRASPPLHRHPPTPGTRTPLVSTPLPDSVKKRRGLVRIPPEQLR
jgi:phage terminase large subunit